MDILRRLFPFLKARSLEVDAMWLLIGLGNPGPQYSGHRHNVGFMAVDRIAREYGFPAFRSKFEGEISEGRIDGQKVALLKPATFMNESGRSGGQAMRFYKVTPNRVIVFHDELDLPPGRLKVKQGGGNGGHNGLKSLDAHIGRPDYWRVRLGIGHPGDKNRVTGYVLGDFSKEEHKWLEGWLEAVAAQAPLLLENKSNDFMTRLAEWSSLNGV